MTPGKRYKGYGSINEFGEFDFTPAQVGSKPDQKKIVKETDEYTIYETKNFVLTSIRIPKTLDFFKRIKFLLCIVDLLMVDLKKYEI